MTTEPLNTESVTPTTESTEKVRRTRKPMPEDRKSAHHKASALLESFFTASPATATKWSGMFQGPNGKPKQLRVLANLLLDYVPGFLESFSDTPDAALVAACETVLTNASADPAAYRKANKPISQPKPAQ